MLATGLGGRDPARRDGDPGADRARGDHADGPLELVAARLAGAAAAGRAVAAHAQWSRAKVPDMNEQIRDSISRVRMSFEPKGENLIVQC